MRGNEIEENSEVNPPPEGGGLLTRIKCGNMDDNIKNMK